MLTKKMFLLFLFLAAPIISYGQPVVEVKYFTVTVDINTTVDNIGLRFDIVFDSTYFTKGYVIDNEAFIKNIKSDAFPRFEFRDSPTDNTFLSSNSIEPRPGKRFIQLKISLSGESKSLLEALKSGARPFYIYLDKPLLVDLEDGTRLSLSPERLKEVSSSAKLSLSERQIDEIVDARGGYYKLYGTKIDAGWQIGKTDSSANAGYLSFNFLGELFPDYLAELGGVISTRANDIAAQFTVSPLIYNVLKSTPIFLKGTYQVKQDGSEERVFGSLLYQTITPNFINLTQGFNRLRLKPVVKVGFNWYYYTKSNDSLVLMKSFAEPYLDIYYYIPVLERYSILFEGSFFWRSDKDFNFIRKNARLTGDISLNYDIPGADSKVMAKYSFGENSLTLQKDNKLVIGVLIDCFERK